MAAPDKGERDIAARAGTNALRLLAIPFNVAALRALDEAPRTLADLRRETGSPPETTVRSYLRSLADTGVVEKGSGEKHAGDYELTSSGRDLLAISKTLADWLASSPGDQMQLGSVEAKNAVKALIDGWSSGMVRALAARPMSLTELDGIIASLSYPALERRLTALRLIGMVQAAPGPGRSTPYTVTPWLRGSVLPLAAAAAWEQRHQSKQAPAIAKRDIEAAFLLALPPLRLPRAASGSCRLAMRMITKGQSNGLTGVTAEVKGGAVMSCVTDLEGSPDAWAHGSPRAWISAIHDRDAQRLELGGETDLACGLVEEMHRGLRFT